MDQVTAALLALVFICPLSALVAFLAAPSVLKFRPGYLKVLVSTIAGYAAGISLQAAMTVLPASLAPTLIGAVLGWFAMGFCHRGLLIGPSGERITLQKAMILVLLQLILGLVILFAVLLAVSSWYAKNHSP